MDTANTTPAPATFRALALQATTQFYTDIHVNLPGIILASVFIYAIIHPEAQDTCEKVAAVATTYLFASTKNK